MQRARSSSLRYLRVERFAVNPALYRYCLRPALSIPVTCTLASGSGEISTSFHAGGITSLRMRSSAAGLFSGFPSPRK